MATRIKFVDVYSLYDDVDVNILENLLEDHNIACVVKRIYSDIHTLGLEGASVKMIAVEEDEVETAKKIIVDAINNGIIKGGRFMV